MTKNEIVLSNIKLKLKEQGKTLGQFESEIGVSNGYFSRIVVKRSAFPLEMILKILKEFNMSFEELITYNCKSLTAIEALEIIEQSLKGNITKSVKSQIYNCTKIIREALSKEVIKDD